MSIASRDAVSAAALALLGLLLWGAGRAILRNGPAGTRFQLEDGLGLAVSVAGLAVLACWSAALLFAIAAEALTRLGHPRSAAQARRLSPAFMRRLAAAVLGAHLVAVPITADAAPAGGFIPAGGTTTALSPARGASVLDAAVLDAAVLARSDSPAPSGAPAEEQKVTPRWKPLPSFCQPGLLGRQPAPRPSTAHAEPTVVVEEGDTLWAIAAEHLGPFATDAEIALEWPRWYSANARVIGPDPSLLTPGEILKPPGDR